MALTVTEKGPLVSPTVPTIYGRQLDWHAVRAETALVNNRTIAPCDRTASIFRAKRGGMYHTIEANANDRKVSLSTDNTEIFFIAEIIDTPDRLRLIQFNTHLKYPPTHRLRGQRYEGMPYLREITPSVWRYFENIYGHVDGIRSIWENDPRSDNYNAFIHALSTLGLSQEEATRTTPAWRDAQRLGCTSIGTPKKNDQGDWTVEFYRPEVTTRRLPFS